MTYAITGAGIEVPYRKVSGAYAVAARCIVRLGSRRNEWKDDPGRGLYPIETLALLRSDQIRQLVIAQLVQVTGVVDVVSAIATVSSGSLQVSAVIRAQDEQGNIVDLDLAEGLPYAVSTMPTYLTILQMGANPFVIGGA